ncbi:hypothetical protein C8Q80DRAFT_1204519 [Daedaleopsis nitida]|nr:hypothetical protein C8Q80DRAFT_1204519 [Daedaleopsis nitida]
MQLSAKFAALAFTFGSVLIAKVVATPVVAGTVARDTAVDVDVVSDAEPTSFVVSQEEMMHWLATTDAELTFLGEPINPLAPRAAQNTMVTYCNRRVVNVCGGACTFYNGNAKCLSAPGTACLAATTNVGFCDRSGCGHSCNQLSTCGTRLDNGFCYTPGTASILVPAT